MSGRSPSGREAAGDASRPRATGGRRPGSLALVLHTHMPYVEGGAPWPPPDAAAFLQRPDGFGTWPFGEEWLWEAVASCYVPLLEVLGDAPVTLSLTPVLCDQLEAPGALERCLRFLGEIRPESHARDAAHFRRQGEEGLAAEMERSQAEYAERTRSLRELGPGLLSRLGSLATWTSAATHAVLPLLASDRGAQLQVQSGIAAHRRRFGEWAGGFWLPECAHAPWLDGLLVQSGARATCVELTGGLELGDTRHLRPLVSDEGLVLWPIDRQTIALVWSERGYPAGAAYRDYHRLTPHHHRAWSNDGLVYDMARAQALVREHAADFVGRVRDRVRDGGFCVCALDTELLGHWWYEGIWWLGAVLEESARQGLPLVGLDEASEQAGPLPAPAHMPVSSWGEGGDLRTWSAPRVSELAWLSRTAELQALRQLRGDALRTPHAQRALRELLALQASDWAFLQYRGMAGQYPRERAEAHAEAFAAALEGRLEPGDGLEAVANLAPELVGWEG